MARLVSDMWWYDMLSRIYNEADLSGGSEKASSSEVVIHYVILLSLKTLEYPQSFIYAYHQCQGCGWNVRCELSDLKLIDSNQYHP